MKLFIRISESAYKLMLPPASKIYLVFHVAELKGRISKECLLETYLREINQDDQLIPVLNVVLERRTRKGREEILVH